MELFHIFPQKFLGNPKESPNFAPAFGKRRVSSTSLSSPNASMRIVLWCNGNTTGFGSVIPGSNPGSTTQGKRHPRFPKVPKVSFFLSVGLVAQLVRATDS